MSKLGLFVFVDALGWEIQKKYPFLNGDLPNRAPLETIFGYSSACDPSILTGKYPEEHNHFSFFYYNPKKSPFSLCRPLSIFPKWLTRRGRVRRLMSRLIGRLYGFTGYFQIYNMPFNKIHLFDYSEKKDIYEAGGINSGDETIFDYYRQNNIPFHYSNWRKGEAFNLDYAKKDLSQGKVKSCYLFLGHLDAVLHEFGTDHENVANKIKWYEEQLASVFKTARENYDEVDIYVFSDHGMTNVIRDYDLMADIATLPLTFNKDYAAVYDSTMARFWFFNDRAKELIVEKLNTVSCGRILSEEDNIRYHCNFKTNMYGDLFYLLDPGVLLNPSFMGEYSLKGMHGYDAFDKDSVAAMFSSKSGELPKNLTEIYNVMKKYGSP